MLSQLSHNLGIIPPFCYSDSNSISVIKRKALPGFVTGRSFSFRISNLFIDLSSNIKRCMLFVLYLRPLRRVSLILKKHEKKQIQIQQLNVKWLCRTVNG